MIASRGLTPLLLFTGLAVIASDLLIVPWPVQAQSNPTTPTRPNNLPGAIVNGGIALRWYAPTENAEAVYGYQILRRRPNEGETTLTILVPDTGSTALTYTDDDATEAGDTYAYKVKAIAIRGDVTSQSPNGVVVEAEETSSETDTENTATKEVVLSNLVQRGPEARWVFQGSPARAFSFALSQPRRSLTERRFTSWVVISAARLHELSISGVAPTGMAKCVKTNGQGSEEVTNRKDFPIQRFES